MKIMITGAAGYIGHHVVKAFCNAGHDDQYILLLR